VALELVRQVQQGPKQTPSGPTIADRISFEVVNEQVEREARFRHVITPRIAIDQTARHIQLISQGLSLTEERRSCGQEAIMLEVAARYRRGEGAIRQHYRYLLFTENSKAYCQRLPMGAWAPADPDLCLEWLGRGGLQQGDFVLLPRKRLPATAVEIPRPARGNLLQRLSDGFQHFVGEVILDEQVATSDWEHVIGRHDPQGCRLFRNQARHYLLAPTDTVSRHPEHEVLEIPEGLYEVVEDRASSYWRQAID
jgi:hypothetical protein